MLHMLILCSKEREESEEREESGLANRNPPLAREGFIRNRPDDLLLHCSREFRHSTSSRRPPNNSTPTIILVLSLCSDHPSPQKYHNDDVSSQ